MLLIQDYLQEKGKDSKFVEVLLYKDYGMAKQGEVILVPRSTVDRYEREGIGDKVEL